MNLRRCHPRRRLMGVSSGGQILFLFHFARRLRDVGTEERLTQLMGFWKRSPKNLALIIVTTLSLVTHLESLPPNTEGLVPPPEVVRGGENESLPEIEHAIYPGAAQMDGLVRACAVAEVRNTEEARAAPTTVDVQTTRPRALVRFA